MKIDYKKQQGEETYGFTINQIKHAVKLNVSKLQTQRIRNQIDELTFDVNINELRKQTLYFVSCVEDYDLAPEEVIEELSVWIAEYFDEIIGRTIPTQIEEENDLGYEDDSDRSCKDCPDDECTGRCMSCCYRPV